jgi:hypothetical protein
MDKAALNKKSKAQLETMAKKIGANVKTPDGKVKTKTQLVNSIIMKNRLNGGKVKTAKKTTTRKPGTQRKKSASKAAAVKRLTKRVTMKGSGQRTMKRISTIGKRRPAKMMMDGYNGFTNYETWLVNLHFQDLFYELAQEQYDDLKSIDVSDLADVFSDVVNDMTFELIQGNDTYFVNDMINAFLAQVNYGELATMASEDFQ